MKNRPPMKAWKVVLLTLLALAVLFAVAIPVFSKKIEATIATDVEAALRKGEADWVTFAVDGRDVLIKGVAPNKQEMARAKAMVLAVEGVRVVRDEISLADVSSPYLFDVDFNGETVALSGYAESEGDKKIILRQATEAFQGYDLKEDIKVLEGAPDDWLVSVTTSLQQLARLGNGKLAIRDTAIHMEGEAESVPALDAVQRELAELSRNQYSLDFAVTAVAPADAEAGEAEAAATAQDMEAGRPATVTELPVVAAFDCQKAFDELLAKKRIRFATGKTRITRRSYGLLEELRDIAQQCPQSLIEVAGYTDSQGGAKRNKELSLARAQAVVKWLVEHGVNPDQLTAAGYGESNPVATNKTRAGRALNRRIEFKVKGE